MNYYVSVDTFRADTDTAVRARWSHRGQPTTLDKDGADAEADSENGFIGKGPGQCTSYSKDVQRVCSGACYSIDICTSLFG